ncbi:MAG: selenium metabolism-associated LysR family transcriptional regulator [Clostridia bacterium]|nr:selenium metabolism-associated LysR family transcriptional regulator [Clostridia bacterium]
MDIKQLEAFVYVVENASFSKAGKALHLTQPTISAHICALEQELGVKLVARSVKETCPLDAGKLLYTYAKDILAMREKAVQAVVNFSKEMRGTISIAASTIPGQYYLPRLVQCFREKYPDIKFDIQLTDSAEAVNRVASRSTEIGFTGTLMDTPKCVFREFADDRLVVVTPNLPRFAQYRQGVFPVKKILGEPFISREAGSGTRKETELFLREMGVDPARLKIAVEVRATESIIKMVSEGVGIAVLSKSACEDYCQFHKILAFDFDNVTLQRKLYIVRRRTGMLSPIAQAFYAYARDFYKIREKGEISSRIDGSKEQQRAISP